MLCDALRASLEAARYDATAEPDAGPPPHVVIVPVDSPAESLQLCARMLARWPQAAVVVLGHGCSEDDLLAFIEAGATAYVDRVQSLGHLLAAIEAVTRRRAPASGHLAAQVVRRIQHLRRQVGFEAPRRALTAREQVILGLIGRGCSNKEIAEELAISSSTVKNHVHRMLEKLEVRGRREAVRVALRANMRVPSAATEELTVGGTPSK